VNGPASASRDPLREARFIKRFLQVSIGLAVVVVQATFFLALDYSFTQTLAGFVVGESLALVSIEATFHQIFQLRKRGAYPTIMAVELGEAQDLAEACQVGLTLARRYLGATHSFLAWVDGARDLTPMCEDCMPEGWAELAEADGEWLAAVRAAIDGRAPVVRRLGAGPLSRALEGAHSWALTPLLVRGRVAGVLFLAGPRRARDVRDGKMLESVGMVIGLALENMRLRAKEYESIMQVLCSALDMRDSATEGHSRRVARMAGVIAEQLGLPRGQVRLIEQAAALHDVGKIGVADAILSKPGPLSEEEWREMRRHPRLGYDIVQGIETLGSVAEIIHSHHERYEGGGYPRGLRGEEIPYGARIFAVVDTYDAMTSHRPYRRARPHAEAVQEIVRNAGSQFDPAVVQAFLAVERAGLIAPHDSPDAGEPVGRPGNALAAGQRQRSG
jgi:HD-GYP domain-containing protein (c-di-GMP phosphodiesterase class II)